MSYSNSDEQEIINELKEGGIQGERAASKLYSKFYYNFIYRIGIKKFFLKEEQSIDAYNLTITDAHKNIKNGTFRSESTLYTYLYKIFHYKCVDIIRAKTTIKEKMIEENTSNLLHAQSKIDSEKAELEYTDSDGYGYPSPLWMTSSEESVIDFLDKKEDLELLKKLIGQLDEKCQQLLEHQIRYYSDKEIAIKLGYKNTDVVKTSRLRCIKKIINVYKGKL